MTSAKKKSTIQLLASLNWCSRTEFAIASLVWLITFGSFLNEPGVELPPDTETPNFFLVMLWCFGTSVPLLFVQRWIKKIPKGIKWLWVEAIHKLDK